MVCVCKIRPYLLRRKVLLAAFQHFDNIYLIPSFLSGIFIWHLFGQSIWQSILHSILKLAQERRGREGGRGLRRRKKDEEKDESHVHLLKSGDPGSWGKNCKGMVVVFKKKLTWT